MTTTHTTADKDASRYSPKATCNGWHDWHDDRCARCGIAAPEGGRGPDAPECPSWCSLPAGHPYGPEDGGVRRRTHTCERQVSEGWAVEVWAIEERSVEGVTYSNPGVSVQVPEELTSAEAFALAEAIYRAGLAAVDASVTR